MPSASQPRLAVRLRGIFLRTARELRLGAHFDEIRYHHDGESAVEDMAAEEPFDRAD